MKNKLGFPKKVFVSFLLIAAAMIAPVSCDTTPETSPSAVSSAEAATVVGEGQISFPFTATLLDGTVKSYTVNTDKATVGDALLEVGLIQGSEGAYGLYVDTVCGERHLYEEDGKYWAFYIDGEMAMTGVDGAAAEAGHTYELKAE